MQTFVEILKKTKKRIAGSKKPRIFAGCFLISSV
jgi:hypothetical protein